MRKWVLASLLLVVHSALFAEPRALIVVNVNYPHGRKASYKDVDVARQIAYALGFKPWQIKVLINATLEQFFKVWREWIVDGVTENDPMFFYFSGEGCRVEEKNDDKNKDEADNYDEGIVMVGDKDSSTVLDDLLYIMLQEVKAKKKLVILDCCYAAGSLRGLREIVPSGSGYIPSFFFDEEKPQDFVALTAARGEIPVPPPDEPSGFTKLIRDAIVYREADLDKDHAVTLEEVKRYSLEIKKAPYLVSASPSFACYNLLNFARPSAHPELCANCIKRTLFPNATSVSAIDLSQTELHNREIINLSFTMPTNGYLYLFEISPSHMFKLLYPLSETDRSNFFWMGERVSISPGKVQLQASPPYGESAMLVVVTKRPIPFDKFRPFTQKIGHVLTFNPIGVYKLSQELNGPYDDTFVDISIVSVIP